MSTVIEKQIDAVRWFKMHFGLGADETFRADRLCPVCGCWSCDVSHRMDTEYGRLRPAWVCRRCHNSGAGIFSLVKVLTKGLPTLDAGTRWLESQGVTVDAAILETGYGIFPLGKDGANLMAHEEAMRRAVERKVQYQEATPSTEERIAALEAELSVLKARE